MGSQLVVRGAMRSHPECVLLAVLVAACSAAIGHGPPAVQPALTALARLGYACDSGIKDNVPSGLYQWHCARTRDGFDSIVLVNGNDQGIAEFDIDVRDTDPARARDAFAETIATVPPLSAASWLSSGLDGWVGPQASRTVNGVRVTGMCDATQCTVFIVTAGDPLRPLPIQ